MRTLQRAVKSEMSTGLPLPPLYPNLERAQMRFKIGTVAMVAGQPGSFKSTLALNFVNRLVEEEVTSLYISTEDDELTVAKRMAAMRSGHTIEHVMKSIRHGGYDDHLRRISQFVSFEFKALPIEGIDNRMKAFRKKHGRFPQVLWIDNLMSIVDDPTSWKDQMTMVRDLAQIAVAAKTCVIVLHHTREEPPKDKTLPQPPGRYEIHGKLAQFPKTIFTIDTVPMGVGGNMHMGVAPVKLNDGPQDNTGRTFENFIVTPEIARIVEFRQGQPSG